MAGLLIAAWAPWIELRDAALGAALGGGGLWLLATAWVLLRREEGMGLGDVKMLAMIGAFLGWQGVVVTVFLASLAGAALGLALVASRRLDLKSRLPFGVFLAAGALVALFAGDRLIGGEGDDVYYLWERGARVREAQDEGVDTVAVLARSYTLGSHLEDLTAYGWRGFSGRLT